MTTKIAALNAIAVATFGLIVGLHTSSTAQSTETVPVEPFPVPMQEAPPAPELIYTPEAVPAYPAMTPTSTLCGAHNSASATGYVDGYIVDQPAVDDEAPYVVVIPGDNADLLNSVRQCVTDAYQAEGARGDYIRAGAFNSRRAAEQLSAHLRSMDLDARVVYFP